MKASFEHRPFLRVTPLTLTSFSNLFVVYGVLHNKCVGNSVLGVM